MIELLTPDKLRALKPRYRDFMEQHVYPEELKALSTPFKTLEFGWLKNLREGAKKEKLWAPHLPESMGGLGLSLLEFAQISEILGTSPFGHFIFNCQPPDIGNQELLHLFGTEEQKSTFLNSLTEGKIRSCFSMTEPDNPGSNPTKMGTTAIKKDGQYVINGRKWFTTAADGASFAIVMAVTDPENPNPYQRASMILVPTDTPGFKLVRNIPVMGESGEGWLSHGEIAYENCTVPEENLIGPEGSGFTLAQERLGPGRIHHCMRWIGICERAFDLLCKRAISREIKDGVKLGSQQTIQNWIAELRAEINASRLMVLDAAWKIEQQGAKAARVEISTIKFMVAKVLQKTLDAAIQVHGALGMTDDTILSFWYRHERAARIYDGPDEVHKSVLARHILKEYGMDTSKKQ
ncbi:acyl-CoA dehydrogenase family protein [Algoriphagus sp.]|uniref:acyl-CoA dehydrogenase family protein n=1 Tax=Algoriphagus sp. TaxID=1872435 RepID=UPI0025F9D315|nr:acyl-CoA dehydrogenase family protein [Algoriphagus sp.]